MKLTPEAFDRAKAFIQNQARPLEQALFTYHFENGSQDAVLNELSKFQHERRPPRRSTIKPRSRSRKPKRRRRLAPLLVLGQ
jgi:hypothetical protein